MYSFKVEDDLYDWISCLEKDRLYFGPFPNQLMIDRLIEEKFDIIVNLTMDDEEVLKHIEDKDDITGYKVSKNKYISYQIKDNDIPTCPISYCSFILKLYNLYKNNKKGVWSDGSGFWGGIDHKNDFIGTLKKEGRKFVIVK